jgi:hypothetical protein
VRRFCCVRLAIQFSVATGVAESGHSRSISSDEGLGSFLGLSHETGNVAYVVWSGVGSVNLTRVAVAHQDDEGSARIRYMPVGVFFLTDEQGSPTLLQQV